MKNKPANVAKEIVEISGGQEVSQSVMEYSMSVVYSRAIPSAVDGLKPVQRRVLYTMMQMGLTNDKSHMKSARPVGECMGKFHPHGDSSIYESLVKLAQPFYLNIPMVDGYGNFGDVSGSGAAAPRYTEARLAKEAAFMLQEVREDTVDMRPNYDGEHMEPTVLPVMFPSLLVNGNFGIGIGFASKFALHNPQESIEAAKALLKNPDITLKQLMKYIPGPDFPTGATILGTDGIEEAYSTGQGVIRLQAKHEVKSIGRGKHEIIFTELPYGVKTETVITKIKDAIRVGKLQGIADAKDLTDHKNGLRIVVELKAGINPKVFLVELFKNTPLEDSFGINNTALVEGEPKVIGLKEILEIFVSHRKQVVIRRSEFRKKKRADRLHLVEGLLKALASIDEVIKIVRAASDATVAQQNLIKKFKVDEIQADYILAIPLRRLTKFDQLELNAEKKKLQEEIKELDKILGDPEVLKSVILTELDEVKKVIARPRRSVILDGDLATHQAAVKEIVANTSAEVEDEDCFVVLTNKGTISRVTKAPAGAFSTAKGTTRGKFIAVTNKGRAFRIETLHVGTRAAAVSTVLPEKLPRGENVIAVTPTDLAEGQTGGIAMGTRNGVVKIVSPQWPVRSDDFSVIGLDADDEILAARWVDDVKTAELVFVSSDSSLLTFSAEKVRPQGLSGAGMAGIKLAPEQKAIAFSVVLADEKAKTMVTTYTGQTIKTSAYGEFPAKGRATGGVRSHKFLRGESIVKLAAVSVGGLLYASDGKEVPLPKPSKRDASGTKFEDETIF
jgi:DNA gyrase subunit A